MHGMPDFHNGIRQIVEYCEECVANCMFLLLARQVNSVPDIQVPSESTNRSVRTAECLEREMTSFIKTK